MAAEKKAKSTKTAKAPAKSEAKVHKFQDYTIKTKRSGRFLVLGKNGKTVNGADKTKILVDAKLVSAGTPKPKEEAPTA